MQAPLGCRKRWISCLQQVLAVGRQKSQIECYFKRSYYFFTRWKKISTMIRTIEYQDHENVKTYSKLSFQTMFNFFSFFYCLFKWFRVSLLSFIAIDTFTFINFSMINSHSHLQEFASRWWLWTWSASDLYMLWAKKANVFGRKINWKLKQMIWRKSIINVSNNRKFAFFRVT